jgi:hypothetical protein
MPETINGVPSKDLVSRSRDTAFFCFGLKKVGAWPQFWYGAKWPSNSSEKVNAQDYCVYIDELEPFNCFVKY